MANSAFCIAEVRTTGSDTLNGGFFDPSQTAGMFTDGKASAANTASPVFSTNNPSYSFVAGDVGAWVFIASGSTFIPGWYPIASVGGGAATLDAAIGHAILVSATGIPIGLNTVAGCATAPTPLGGTYAIDYSQQNAAQYTYTDLISAGAGLTVSSAAHPFSGEQVGNSIVVTGGTNFNTGRYVIASVTAGVATLTGPGNVTTGVGAAGTGGQGGAFASPGAAGAVMVAGQDMFVKSGTYSVTSASSNVAGGCFTAPAGSSASNATVVTGYNTYRFDFGTRPLVQASGIATFTLVTLGANNVLQNISLDAASLTAGRGVNAPSACELYLVKGANCKNSAVNLNSSAVAIQCEFTGCATSAAVVGGGFYLGCTSHDNSGVDGFQNPTACYRCAASNNTGSGNGFHSSSATQIFANCTAYKNGGSGFITSAISNPIVCINCVSTDNSGYGFSATAAMAMMSLVNCAGYNNTSGDVNPTITTPPINFVHVTAGTPFTNAAGNDFSLNSTVNQGALLRAAGIPGAGASNQLPGLSTLSYLDIGAAQHQDPATTNVVQACQVSNTLLLDRFAPVPY